MINAFKYFGASPHEILFDNTKTVVAHSKSTFSKNERQLRKGKTTIGKNA